MTAADAVTVPDDALDSRRGWLVVAATFLSTFVVFGLVYSFGSFFESMAQDFHTGRGATAFMFAVTTAFYFGLGLVSGKAGDRWGPRPLLIVSAIFLVLGMVATSRVHSIWVGYLTYGVGVGVATACAYVPMVAFVGGWFKRHRTAALGVAVSGIGMGTLVVAPLSSALIRAHGWRNSFVILGIAGAVLLLLAAVAARRPPGGVTTDQVPVRTTMRDRGFIILYAATFLMSLTLFVPFVFLKDYATGHGVAVGPASALVGIIGAASVVGRLGLGALGNRLGAVRLTQLSFATIAASFILWLTAGGSFVILVIYAIVLGVGYGGFIALTPAVVAGLYGTVGLGGVLGALYTAAGLGGLFGSPLAGALIDATSYTVTIVVSMAITAGAAAVLLLLPRSAM
ncbi:putative MFS family arabinose efflux permease [Antricoccus suffuscus]|uniref:Putative MFS family arabinose efflux permease n=1 Tax=Antricoccus suffuscus TaxID=1629062 RepID=A0A2T0ZZH1_9ACTN|nr:MFS transporter [Antricoccus suffuscus]PRZ41755.1 putative MFS family arabinose efflux permease [Antricoccus suffuscus]